MTIPQERRSVVRQTGQFTTSDFLKLKQFAVVGASMDQSKFGNKVLRCYQERSKKVTAINKKTKSPIEGCVTLASLSDLASNLEGNTRAADVGVSIITPPVVTKAIIEEGISKGFKHYFLQPGTTNADTNAYIRLIKATHRDVHVLEDCVLVQLHFNGFDGEDF